VPLYLEPFPSGRADDVVVNSRLWGSQREYRCLVLKVELTEAGDLQCLWFWLFDDVDGLRRGVDALIEICDNEWLIERLDHPTPRETFRDATTAEAA
jgi:hypothetical protein